MAKRESYSQNIECPSCGIRVLHNGRKMKTRFTVEA
jgi:DNA-directed RNA polymerase subunit RPC12/RpoP